MRIAFLGAMSEQVELLCYRPCSPPRSYIERRVNPPCAVQGKKKKKWMMSVINEVILYMRTHIYLSFMLLNMQQKRWSSSLSPSHPTW